MSYTFEKLPDEPILFVRYGADFTIEQLIDVWAQSDEKAVGSDEILYRVCDATALDIDFGKMTQYMADMVRATNQPGSINDPRFVDIVIVNPRTLIKLAAESLKQDQYGGIDLPMYESEEDALAFVREQIAARG